MLPRIHCITDSATPDRAHLDLIARVVAAGVDAVQVRAKTLPDRALLAFAEAVVATVRPLGATVIVNDRLDIALAAGADGVHLGRDDLPVAAARALVPQGFLVGATCRNPEHARRSRADGADYAGVGPVFATSTKTGLPDPIGLDVLRATAAEIPAVAIAGIDASRVPDVMATGAYGVAVVSAVWGATDPPTAAKEIAERVRAA
ncbi:MAG: thiamine phosphate synthase [Nocardioides sp.]